MSDDVLTQRRAGLPAQITILHQPQDKENDFMVDTFGSRPISGGILAPFGFAPRVPLSRDASSGGNGQGIDFPDVIPAQYYCQNVNCGSPTGGVVYPLCVQCNNRLKLGGPPITLENGKEIKKPIRPGQ